MHLTRKQHLGKFASAGMATRFSMVLVCLILSGICGCVKEERHGARYEKELEPVIGFVDHFIKGNGRLPSDEEFHQTADKLAWMVVLRDKSHGYAAGKGARGEMDYMVGIWTGEWYYYFQSWDRQFINASDESP